MENQSYCLYFLNKYNKCLSICDEVLRIKEEVLEKNDFQIADTYCLMGSVLNKLEKHEDSEAKYLMAIDILKQQVGEQHLLKKGETLYKLALNYQT